MSEGKVTKNIEIQFKRDFYFIKETNLEPTENAEHYTTNSLNYDSLEINDQT